MPRLALGLLAAAACSTPAVGQWVWQDGSREGQLKPVMSGPVGNPDAIGRLMWRNLQLQAARESACWQLGCIIIVNGSDSYRLEAFYVRPVEPRAKDDWGPNQIERPLGAREAAVRFKLPDARFCNWPVRAVMRHRKTREVIPVEANASLCVSPRQDTVLNVRVVHPDVEVQEPPAG